MTLLRVFFCVSSCLGLFLWPCRSPAQQRTEFAFDYRVERDFVDALARFKDHDYLVADSFFQELIRRRPIHQRTTAAYIMGAKTLLRLERYEQSVQILNDFIQKFPSSRYIDDAFFTLALDKYLQDRQADAAYGIVRAIDLTSDPALLARRYSIMEFIVGDRLTGETLKNLLAMAVRSRSRDLLLLRLGEWYSSTGDLDRAREIFEDLTRTGTSGVYGQRAGVYLERLQRGETIRIGVMLPLMEGSPPGPIKTVSSEVLEGIQFAVNEYRSRDKVGRPIVLEVRDTQRDSGTALRITRELAAIHDVIAIVGPLFSGIASVCAPLVNLLEIPMISPTATANGITGPGSYFFQANPDYDTRGKAMARYALQYLGMQKIAILTCDEPAQRTVSQAFSDEVQRLGGEIIAEERYRRGQIDLRDQLMRIRRRGMTDEPRVSLSRDTPRALLGSVIGAGADPHVVDSLSKWGGTIGVTALFGPRGRRIADSLGLKIIPENLVGEDPSIPITSMDAIFALVADPDDIGVVASQLAYFNIKTQLLGNDEWNDLPALNAHRHYVNGMLFTSDSFVDSDGHEVIDFESAFRHSTGTRPTKYSIFGYDTMKMILLKIAGGATTRATLRSALSDVREFPGVHSFITLNPDNINSSLHILKYENGSIVKLMGITVH